MGLPAAVIPLIGAAAQFGGGLMANASNEKMNAANHRFQWEMYDRQRGHALDDWNMQNEYNSPKNQMQRYKDAGLNPFSVAGNMSSGPTVRSSSGGSSNSKPNDYSFLAGAFQAFFQLQQTLADTQRTEAQTKYLNSQIPLNQAKTDATVQDTTRKNELQPFVLGNLDWRNTIAGKTSRNLDKTYDKMGIDIEKTSADIDRIKASTNFTIHQDARAALLTASSLAQAAERILQMRAQTAKTWEEKRTIQEQYKNLAHLRNGTLQANLNAEDRHQINLLEMRLKQGLIDKTDLQNDAYWLDKFMDVLKTVSPKTR